MLEQSLARLKKSGYKITSQRKAVLQAFAECGDFPAATDILQIVRRTKPDISLDTIYRNLTLLVRLGIIHEIYRSSGNVYELVSTGHHHHLVCTECGCTVCIDICPMQAAYEEQAAKHGFLLTGHVFEFYGICAKCREKLGDK